MSKLKDKVLVDIGDGELWLEKELKERCFKYTVYGKYFNFYDVRKTVISLLGVLEEAKKFYEQMGYSYEEREVKLLDKVINKIKEYFQDVFESDEKEC